MTLQNLSKILDKYDKQQLGISTDTQQLKLLKGLPFYNFQIHEDIQTFNHAIAYHRRMDKNLPYSIMNC
jgi:hypothetical protein